MSDSQEELRRVVGTLQPILEPAGFEFEAADDGVSSGGPFAAGFFSRPPARIGLIVRGAELGLPNYDWLGAIAGHGDLVRALGRGEEALLEWDEERWRLTTRDGRETVAALAHDLANIIVPALEGDAEPFGRAVAQAHAAHQRWLRGEAD